MGYAAPETALKDAKNDIPIRNFTLSTGKTSARYIRMIVNATKVLPEWHPFAGNKSWVFIDEVTVK
jgi:hexosaminidase